MKATHWEFAEIVVVNDGSTDKTAGVARAAGARVLENPGNRGKGYSVRHGMLDAKGDWALLTDADLSAPIEELDGSGMRWRRKTRRPRSAPARSTGP